MVVHQLGTTEVVGSNPSKEVDPAREWIFIQNLDLNLDSKGTHSDT